MTWQLLVGTFLLFLSTLALIRLATYTHTEINYNTKSGILSGFGGLSLIMGVIAILEGLK